MRRTPPREVINGVNGKKTEIKPNGEVYDLWVGDARVATHWSPRWLSDSALMSGALEVRWGFSLVGVET